MSVKIAIIDDKATNRNILKDKLLRYGHFEITITAVDGKDFLDKIKCASADQMPDVALMDLEMPNMDGVDAIAVGSTLYPAIKFVVLTIFDDEQKIFDAIKAGAFGYLLKDESAENICEMLWQMYESGSGPISPGLSYKEISIRLNISVNTAKKHVINIYQKLHVNSRAQAMHLAYEKGLL